MAQKASRPARANGTDLGIGSCSAALSKPEYSRPTPFNQQPIDIVDLLARRTGVAAATVRVHCEAFGIGGAHG